jgi:hypothetical protein
VDLRGLFVRVGWDRGGMSRFQKRYSERENGAVLRAQLELGLSPQRTVELAAEGRLQYDGKVVPAFKMPVATARGKRDDEKKRRRTQEVIEQGAGAELGEICAELLWSARRESRRIKQTTGGVDPDRIARAAKATREVAALVKQLERNGPPEKPTPEKPESTGEQDWLAEVAAKSRLDGRRGSVRRPKKAKVATRHGGGGE